MKTHKLTDDQLCDRFDRYGALYMLASRWHSGQWSRGYRLLGKLSNAGYRPGLTIQNGHRFENETQRMYYKRYLSLRNTL